MNRPRTSVLPTAAAILLCCLAASSLQAETSARTVTSGDQLLLGSRAEGQPGDVVLENDEIAVIISGIGHVTHYGEAGGTVIDAGLVAGRVDALDELYTYFDDDWPRQAVYTSLAIIDDGSGGGPAVVRATGHDAQAPAMSVATDYALGDGDRFLTLTTSVTGGGSVVPGFELGDAFAWGSCAKYAPGYGYAVSGTTTQPWLAGRAPEVCYAYGGAYGDCWGPNGAAWSDVNVVTETLDPVLPVTYVRYLAVAQGDIGAAVSVLYEAQGAPTGELTCNVRDATNGAAAVGAGVEVYAAAGGPFLETFSNGSGQATVLLPPGTWRVIAGMAGYVSAEGTLTVSLGGRHDLDLDLVPTGSGGSAVGDTLTVIRRPLVNVPAFAAPGDPLVIECVADAATTGWQAELAVSAHTVPLPISSAVYRPDTEWWELTTTVPAVPLHELYDLRVRADGGLQDTTRDAVRVLGAYRQDYYFVHITDTHLPDHRFSDSGGAPADSTEMVDLRAVIDDINLINPEFVLITGDYINEGELEDYLEWRSYTRAQRMLYEFDVPTFLVAGNHDLGGWVATPPPAGTARRNWWRFFGWGSLADPPAGAPARTQDYSFDYGPVHYVGLESYNNYDLWRDFIYGSDSFTGDQLAWLAADLAQSGGQANVLFYHKDFQSQIDLASLGIDMALWGHIHGDRGDLDVTPYDLGTDNVCDGARSYRLIRVSGAALQPEPTLTAGAAGQNLTVAFSPANAGLSSTVTAQVTNGQPQRFENGRLRFVMPAANGNYVATGGVIEQIDSSSVHDICHVAVDIPATGAATVTVSPGATDVPAGGGAVAFGLTGNHPNPFNPMTRLDFALPASGPVEIAVYDLSGREVAVLIAERREAGRHTVAWDGRDHRGHAVPSGVYLVRLVQGDRAATHKITLTR